MIHLLLALTAFAAEAPHPRHVIPGNRVASVSLSQDFLNEQLHEHVKSEFTRDLKISLDPKEDRILFAGEAQVPVEELRAINLEPNLGRFRFQVTAKLSTTKRGHLIISFPLNETFFYPFDSKNPVRDRVIVPVQMLSIALASARGYLAAISGDFGGFDRRTARLDAEKKILDHSIAIEKNKDLREDLLNQREALRLQIAAVPVERKQLQALAKQFASVLNFTGEKEINLNEDLAARRNAIVLKIKLSQLTPYLEGTELAGVRMRADQKDGSGQNFLTVDLNGEIEGDNPPPIVPAHSDRPRAKSAPALVVRLNQSLFESKAVIDAEKAEMSSNLKDFHLDLQDDGMHVSGKYKTLLIFSFPFETIIDFNSVGPDVFDATVRAIKVGGNDFHFLAKFALESLKRRLNHSLKGICHFKYVEEKDSPPALRVTIDPVALVPAFPGLHLVDVDVRSQQLLFKIGKP